jgi:4'-phosphopantetheinyl transferase
MEWKVPPARLRLDVGVVHVWRASLDLGTEDQERAWTILAPEERRRAARMRFAVHRARFVAGRALLRVLLGRYLDLDPRAVPLVVEPGGRPTLDSARQDGPRFSVAHTGSLVLYAFAPDRAVGVDVERVRREMPFTRLAARFFAPAETRALAALPARALPSAFFACWTRKEAVFKAWGASGGLVPSLKRFAVSVAPRESLPRIVFYDDERASGRWSVTTLDPGPAYVAALAVEGSAAPTCFALDWPA